MRLILFLLFFLPLCNQLQAQGGSCPIVYDTSIRVTTISISGIYTNYRLVFRFRNPTNGSKSISVRIYTGIACTTGTHIVTHCTNASGNPNVDRHDTIYFSAITGAAISYIFDSRTGSSSCSGSVCQSTGCLSPSVLSSDMVSLIVMNSATASCIGWQVPHSTEISRFELYESSDNYNFQKIQDYNYSTALSLEEINYCNLRPNAFYRVKIVKTNGQVSFSNIVRYTKMVAGNIYPNPCKNLLYLTDVNTSINGSYSILSADGKIVSTARLNRQPITVAHLAPGTYILTLEKNGEIKRQTFVRQ